MFICDSFLLLLNTSFACGQTTPLIYDSTITSTTDLKCYQLRIEISGEKKLNIFEILLYKLILHSVPRTVKTFYFFGKNLAVTQAYRALPI